MGGQMYVLGFIETIPYLILNLFETMFFSLSLFSGEYVAQFKHTVLLMPNGVNLVTGLPFATENFVSEHSIAQAELKELVATPLQPTKKGKGHAKKKAATAGTDAATPAPAAVETKA